MHVAEITTYIKNTSNGLNIQKNINPMISAKMNNLLLFEALLYDNMPNMTGVNIMANMNHMQSIRGVNATTSKLNR